MTQTQSTLIFDVLCACLGLLPDSAEAAELLIPAYQEPEPNPRPPRSRDVIYYDLTPEDLPSERTQTFSLSASGLPETTSFEPFRLTAICYGPHAEENARLIRAFFMLDGSGMPRSLLRQSGIYPLPDPPLPTVGYEEENSLWRKRADLSFPLRILCRKKYFSPISPIQTPPAVIVTRSGT